MQPFDLDLLLDVGLPLKRPTRYIKIEGVHFIVVLYTESTAGRR